DQNRGSTRQIHPHRALLLKSSLARTRNRQSKILHTPSPKNRTNRRIRYKETPQKVKRSTAQLNAKIDSALKANFDDQLTNAGKSQREVIETLIEAWVIERENR